MEVLAAIDGSPYSRDVLAVARRLSDVLGARVTAVHVHGEHGREAATAAGRAGVPFRLLAGDAATAILDAAETGDAVLTVLGAGGTDHGPAPVGRVTRQVITRAARDLVVVPPSPLAAGRGAPLTIVVPLDGDDATSTALRESLRPFVGVGARVVALHVFNATNAPHYWDRFYYDYLAWQQTFRSPDAPVPPGRLTVGRGSVATAAVDLAVREQATLIAVVWSQHVSPGRAEVVSDLLATAPVPILLVPAVARQAGARLVTRSA